METPPVIVGVGVLWQNESMFHTQPDAQTHRHTDSQTHTDRQMDRHTNRQTDRQTGKESEWTRRKVRTTKNESSVLPPVPQ